MVTAVGYLMERNGLYPFYGLLSQIVITPIDMCFVNDSFRTCEQNWLKHLPKLSLETRAFFNFYG